MILLCFWATVSAFVCLVCSSTVVRNYDDDDDEVVDQSSLHCLITSTGVMSGDSGRRKASSEGGCSKTYIYLHNIFISGTKHKHTHLNTRTQQKNQVGTKVGDLE